MCKLLLDRGEMVDAADNNGHTALHSADFRGQVAVCELLLDHGAKVDAARNESWIPLHFAAGGG